MSELADLFPGFESRSFATDDGTIFARIGGEGPPLVLVHGFPQTHVMWHRIAPALAKRFRIVAPDLRGYGWSSVPRSDSRHEPYSKRAMAMDILRIMDDLGHATFSLVGHDRGARVGYRLALDHPGRLTRLALLDIIPTITMWERMDATRAMQVYHWTFLAQGAPMPERLIGRMPVEWLEHTLASWTRAKDLSGFDPRALAHYRAFFNNPDRIHATCEDYRAGQSRDPEADEADRKASRMITCPTLILWGDKGIPAEGASPLDDWKPFAPGAQGRAIRAGHFLAEENAPETLAALEHFLE
jgi:haloacetate dehalogenase